MKNAIFGIILAVGMFSASALADTFSVTVLDEDTNRFFYGMDDSGNVVFLRTQTNFCDAAGDNCFETFSNGSLVGYSLTAPNLDYDYVKQACFSYSKSCSIENNGNTVVIGDRVVNFGPNLSESFSGNFGGTFAVNGVGDIVVDEQIANAWYEITNTPSVVPHLFAAAISPTPEPPSILLLGIGLASILLYRRTA